MITPSGLTVSRAVRRARRTTAAGEGLRAVRGRLRGRGLAGAELCQQPSLAALRQPWQSLAVRDIDLTVLDRVLDPADNPTRDKGISPVPQGLSPGPVPWREPPPDSGGLPRAEAGVTENRPGVTGVAEQRGLGELLRRWESAQPDDAPITFPGAKPIPVRRARTTSPDFTRTGTTPPGVKADVNAAVAVAADAKAARLGPANGASRGAAPPSSLGVIPTDRDLPGATSLGTSPAGRSLSSTAQTFGALSGGTPTSISPTGAYPSDAHPSGGPSSHRSPATSGGFDGAVADRPGMGGPDVGGPGVGASGVSGSGAGGGGAGVEFSGGDRAAHRWPVAVLAPTDLLGDLEDVVEEALEALVLREAERYGLDAGAP
ncbi:MAG TPA: hypothetical protein VFI00_13810 [Kribbella sp.]|nr:hypothetical protein [Kribbella sp.]